MNSASINISAINGENGIIIQGINEGDQTGNSVSNAGDINGDGFNDVVIGAPGVGAVNLYDPYSYYGAIYSGRSGAAYVVFGGSDINQSQDIALANLNSNQGFSVQNANALGGLGAVVDSGGDVDGDGFDDLVLAAPSTRGFSFDSRYGRYTNHYGETYVIFGGNEIGENLDINELDGNNGFEVVEFESTGSDAGISNSGDINGDGFADTIVESISRGSGPVTSYVVFGKEDLGVDSSDRFEIKNGDRFSANPISNAGDLNGDGFDDLILGSPGSGTSVTRGYNLVRGYYYFTEQRGRSYVIFGSENIGTSGEFDLDNLNGNNGFTIDGINERDFSGYAVSNGGDLNGDGFADLVVTAPSVDSVYVVFGGTNVGNSGNISLTELNGNNGFVIEGNSERLGKAVNNAGDLNGDGFADLVVTGQSPYVIFGGANLGSSGAINVANLNGDNGFAVAGIDGDTAIDNAGDLNGDNFDDLVIGAPEANSSGEVYVVFGGSDIVADFNSGNNNGNNNNINQLITGTSGKDTLNGLAGNDTIRGDRGADIIRGGLDQDLLAGNQGNDTVFGGAGNDTLFGGSGNDLLQGNKGKDSIFGNLGFDTLFGGDGDDTLQGGKGNDILGGNAGADILQGNSGKDTLFGGDGNDTLVGGHGSDFFELTRGGNVGTDRITDYQDGIDKILLTDRFNLGALTFDDLNLVQNGTAAQIRIGANNQLLAVLSNTNVSELNADDFEVG